MITVEEYVDRLGRNRFDEWRRGLDYSVQQRIDGAVGRLRVGHVSNLKALGEGLQEMKLTFGPGYRIYLGRRSTGWIVLLSGGSKARQSQDIALARKLWKEATEEA